MKNVLFSLLLVALFTGCKYVGESSKHFSSQMESVDEPQTDDERTFVEEYNDFLVLADSLADVWDGNDTLTMRRLYHNQRDQQRRVEKMKDRPNIRHSMVEKVLGNVEKIGSEIAQKFSPELCKELYVFHEFFDLNKHSYSDLNVRKVIDGKIYTNSLGEHYLFVRKTYYDLIEGHLHPSDIMTKHFGIYILSSLILFEQVVLLLVGINEHEEIGILAEDKSLLYKPSFLSKII